MVDDVEGRLRSLEDSRTRLKVVAAIVAALGISAAGVATYLNDRLSFTLKQVQQLSAEVSHANESFQKIDPLIAQKVEEKVNLEVLSKSFRPDAVLAQVEAQSICSSMTIGKEGMSVQAVFRRLLKGNVALRCLDICKQVVGANNQPMTSLIGAVHVYTDHVPFSPFEDKEAFSQGMETFVYSEGQNSDTFGPNYCCCGG